MATYYVDYISGSESNNGTSIGTPWKYVPGDSRSSHSLSDGDTVIFKLGVTYSFSGSSHYVHSQADNVTWTVDVSWGTGVATLDGADQNYLIQVDDDGNTFDGVDSNLRLQFTGTSVEHAALIIANDSGSTSGTTVRYCRFYSVGTDGVGEGIGLKVGGLEETNENIDISYCEFANNYSYGLKLSGNPSRYIEVSYCEFYGNGQDEYKLQINVSQSGSTGNGVHDTEIHHCTIRDGASNAGGISYLNMKNNSFHHNLIYNHDADGIGVENAYAAQGITEVYNNSFYNNRRGIAVASTDSTTYALVYNNLIYNNTQNQIYLTASADYNRFFNNTVYKGTSSYVLMLINSGCSYNVIKNNVFMHEYFYCMEVVSSSEPYTEDYNIFYRGSNPTDNVVYAAGSSFGNDEVTEYRSATGQGANSDFIDPELVNPPSNLSIDSGSPGEEAGTILSSEGFTTDYDGTTRTDPWDIGAYEISVGAEPGPALVWGAAKCIW